MSVPAAVQFFSYKFRVDGMWTHDANAPIISDELGNINNYKSLPTGADSGLVEKAEAAGKRWESLLSQRPSFATSSAAERAITPVQLDPIRLNNQFDALGSLPKKNVTPRKPSYSPYSKPAGKEHAAPALKTKSKKPLKSKQKIIGDDDYKKKR